MPPTRWHPDRKVKLPQPSTTIIQNTDEMLSSSRRPPQKQPPKPSIISAFVHHTLAPLHRHKEPLVPSSLLRDLDITIVPLDFRTCRSTNPHVPALVHLTRLDALHEELERVEPWETLHCPDRDSGYHEYRPRETDREVDYNWEAEWLSQLVSHNLSESESNNSGRTVLDKGSWMACLEEPALKFLGTMRENKPKYQWWVDEVYYNYDGRPPLNYHKIALERSKPHGVCQIVDPTPFDGQRIRTSEAQAITLLDYFGITVMSFWDREVRIVQGLVNFKTNAIELRVSPSQSFDAGVRSSDEQYAKLLTLLAYLGDVQDLSGLPAE